MTGFSPRTFDALIDLVEIKLSYLDVTDREDRMELRILQVALAELEAGRGRPAAARGDSTAVH
jgi:hypothetical protein